MKSPDEDENMDAFFKFFNVYARERINNIHVQSFDMDKPMLSMAKTLFSDILTFSLQFTEQEDRPAFFPFGLCLTDPSKKAGVFLHPNPSLPFEDLVAELTVICESQNTLEHAIFQNHGIIEKRYVGLESGPSNIVAQEQSELLSNLDLHHRHIKLDYSNKDTDSIEDRLSLQFEVVLCSRDQKILGALPERQIKSLCLISVMTKRSVFFTREIKKHALKSAKAAIMARNMSHNIGSHILSYLKARLNSITSIMEKNVIENFIEKVDAGQIKLHRLFREELIEIARLEEEVELPFLIGLGRFVNYLQERQDFIATIATDYIPYFSSINFKDFVFDELNYDYKIERHSNDKTQEQLNQYKTHNILLDNIARSEEFTRSDISLNFRAFDGINDPNGDLNTLRKLVVDLPGGIIGRQALFSIFENLIRNAAKHGGKKADRKLILTIDADMNYSDELIEFTITDNNGNASNDTIRFLKSALQEDLIDDDGKLLETNKGIKEMRISAAWLRNQNIGDRVDPDFFQVSKIDGNIRFTFYLLKPQKMAVIGNFDQATVQKANARIKNSGWHVFTVSEYVAGGNKNFRLALVSKDVRSEDRERICDVSPSRVVTDLAIDLEQLCTEPDLDKTYERYYHQWVARVVHSQREINGSQVSQELPQIVIVDGDKTSQIQDNFDEDKSESAFLNDHVKVLKNAIPKETTKEGEEQPLNLERARILFKKHNDSSIEFENFRNANRKWYGNLDFLEGISGHNSTDRLIRQEVIDRHWVHKMIESSVARVTIFDERIWSIVTGIDQTPFAEDNVIQSLLEILVHVPPGDEKLDRFKATLSEQKQLTEAIEDKILVHKLNEVDANALISQIFGINAFKHEVLWKKGIRVLNIIARGSHFDVVDTRNTTIGRLDCDNWPELSYNQKDNEWAVSDSHFVLIHQGLLDKMYDQFSRSSTEQKTTDQIDRFFGYLKSAFPASVKHIVHSGRSKPYNLPRGSAFIQFSSLENALFDCKYSLTEQLFAARNEQKL